MDEMTETAVQTFFENYIGFTKAAAEHVIKRCETLFKAKTDLSPQGLTELCRRIKLSEKSSTFRKYLTIGENAERLKSEAERLPDSWTTLYELAKLRSDKFDSLVMSEQLHPSMTADDIKAAFSAPHQSATSCSLIVDATGLVDGDKASILRAVNKVAARYGASVRLKGYPEDLISASEHDDTFALEVAA
jgi:hypothetical protein